MVLSTQSSTPTARFVDLPPEILEEILLNLDPVHVACVAQCSRFFRDFVYHSDNQAFWRALYLEQPFDDPRTCVSQNGQPRCEIEWKRELQRFVRARSVLHDMTLCRGAAERVEVLRTLLDMVTYVPPLESPDNLAGISRNLLWVAAVLRRGVFIDRFEEDGGTAGECVVEVGVARAGTGKKRDEGASQLGEEERQLCARLHTYFGLTQLDVKAKTRVKSRAYVYDMRNYSGYNEYGPLDAKGCVNWVHVQALHHVMSMHVVDLQEDEDFEFAIFPMSLPFTQIVVPSGADFDKEQDWAGVSGVWRVSFCFCDHRELLRYNHSFMPGSDVLNPSIFQESDFGEVFRSMDVNLTVTRTESDANHPTRPIIHFKGEMASSSSALKGSVKMTPDEQVQWSFVSGDQGNAVWHSVGIHVGGLRSVFGVLGAWTTVFHDDDDPVGPFWLRRQSSSIDLPMHHVSLNPDIQDNDGE